MAKKFPGIELVMKFFRPIITPNDDLNELQKSIVALTEDEKALETQLAECRCEKEFIQSLYRKLYNDPQRRESMSDMLKELHTSWAKSGWIPAVDNKELVEQGSGI